MSSLGHRHPKVVEAIHQQVDKHLHVMVYGEFIQQPQLEFAELLTAQLPEHLEQVYFVNSGTEAIEGALKLAKSIQNALNWLPLKTVTMAIHTVRFPLPEGMCTVIHICPCCRMSIFWNSIVLKD